MQHFVHFGLHFSAPILVAFIFYRQEWKKASIIMLLTMLVDLDHLLAYPGIFDPNRCSIGFHLLHTFEAIFIYFCMLVPQKTRIVGIGLLLHMATDYLDCHLMML